MDTDSSREFAPKDPDFGHSNVGNRKATTSHDTPSSQCMSQVLGTGARARPSDNLPNSQSIEQSRSLLAPVRSHLKITDRLLREVRPTNCAVKRKFPGPAGIISKKFCNETENLFDDEANLRLFKSDAWAKMLLDRDLNENHSDSIINKFNIKWINSISIPVDQTFRPYIVKFCPTLHIVIKTMRKTNGGTGAVFCTFLDRSGTAMGCIDDKVFSIHEKKLRVGSVLALKEVQIQLNKPLSGFGNYQRYIYVTEGSIIGIYPVSKEVLERPNNDNSAISLETNSGSQDNSVTVLSPKTSEKTVLPKKSDSIEIVQCTSTSTLTSDGALVTNQKLQSKPKIIRSTCKLLDGLEEDALFGDF